MSPRKIWSHTPPENGFAEVEQAFALWLIWARRGHQLQSDPTNLIISWNEGGDVQIGDMTWDHEGPSIQVFYDTKTRRRSSLMHTWSNLPECLSDLFGMLQNQCPACKGTGRTAYLVPAKVAHPYDDPCKPCKGTGRADSV